MNQTQCLEHFLCKTFF